MDNYTEEKLFRDYENLIHKCLKDIHVSKDRYEDAMQEGRIALWLAHSRYDSAKGASFTTYAYQSIKNYVQKYLGRNKLLRPNKEFYRLKKEIFELVDKRGILFEEALDIVFKDKKEFEKSKFVNFLSEQISLDETYMGEGVSIGNMDVIDCRKALDKLKEEDYKIWYIIHEYYILSRLRKHIMKELHVTAYTFDKLHKKGLEILRKNLI